MANSATRVLPAPVGAETITDWPSWIARIASSWNSSRGKENRARKRSIASIVATLPRGACTGRGGGWYAARVIVFHIAVTTVDDYATKREPHRREHIARLSGLRANPILIGGGAAPAAASGYLLSRLPQPRQGRPRAGHGPARTG